MIKGRTQLTNVSSVPRGSRERGGGHEIRIRNSIMSCIQHYVKF